MISLSHLQGKKIAVLGLGLSGMACVRALLAGGARVFAWDDDGARRHQCTELDLKPANLENLNWTEEKFDYLVMSPGIAHTFPCPHRVAGLAKEASCPIICDIELLALAQRRACFVAITGTNGKSTTTALIAHIFKTAGRRMQVGGNLGMPALALDPLGEGGVYVLELSSYQLDLVRESIFDIAVLLNISPDHLERHGTMAGYIAAKEKIFETHGRAGLSAVIGVDDVSSREIYRRIVERNERRCIAIYTNVPGDTDETGRAAITGVYMDGPILMDAMDGGHGKPVLDIRQCTNLPGRHNAQDACAAYATVRLAGIEEKQAALAIRSFQGLAHRQEKVGLARGVAFVNDSKATNGEACARALDCYRNIYWITGGKAKEDRLDGVITHLKEVRHAFLIGEATNDFTQILQGIVPLSQANTLKNAINQAFAMARDDGAHDAVVLLSPACASFDQFKNFSERGDTFRKLALEICARETA